MKKWFGMICSAVAGICGFIFMSISCWNLKVTRYIAGVSGTEKDHANGWDIIKDVKDTNGCVLYKIFAIILLAVSVLLIISAIVLLLKNLNVLKVTMNIELINNILLSVFVLCAIVMLIALGIMSKDASRSTVQEIAGLKVGAKASYSAGIGSWLNLIVGAIACSLSWVFAERK